MVSQIAKIEYTITNSEQESLSLEANLIYNLQPKYNVLLKEEKNNVYIKIRQNPYPTINTARKKIDNNSIYYGPYSSRASIEQVTRTLRTVFPYCQSKNGKKCDYITIGLCNGICDGGEDIKEYTERIEQIENIMRGKTELAEEYINQKISKSIERQNYELAGFYRDRLETLKNLIENNIKHSKQTLPEPQDIDLITLLLSRQADSSDIASVYIQNLRQGKIVNVSNFLLTGENPDDTTIDYLSRFMSSYYMFRSETVKCLVQIFEDQDNKEEPNSKA